MSCETKMSAPNAQTRAALHDFLSAFERFKSANDQRLSEIEKRRNADVLLEEKVARIDAALTRQKAALDRMAVDATRPSIGQSARARPGRAGMPMCAGAMPPP